MRAGNLNKRVVLQAKHSIPDGMGGSLVSWQLYATVWAGIVPGVGARAGKEEFVQQHTTPTALSTITIRYRADVTPAHRVVYGSRVFNILAKHNIDEAQTELELWCEEIVPT